MDTIAGGSAYCQGGEGEGLLCRSTADDRSVHQNTKTCRVLVYDCSVSLWALSCATCPWLGAGGSGRVELGVGRRAQSFLPPARQSELVRRPSRPLDRTRADHSYRPKGHREEGTREGSVRTCTRGERTIQRKVSSTSAKLASPRHTPTHSHHRRSRPIPSRPIQ